MASATMNSVSGAIEPYQPIPGLSVRDQMARAHDHYGGRMTKLLQKHGALVEALRSKVQEKDAEAEARGVRESSWKTQMKTSAVQVTAAAVTSTALGVADGRFGGDRGYVSMWGVPLDGAVAVAGLASSLASYWFTRSILIPSGLGAMGIGGANAFLYRHSKDLGTAWFHKVSADNAAAGAGAPAGAPNGAGKGVTYTVHAAGK